ncbi:MAG TPA: RraA family protein [Vicinamibacterales bacterium]|nr:RraA family protein [Vicinamibacterales bacterium]
MDRELLRGFEWTTPFIADACVMLQLPVRVGPPDLRPVIAGSRITGRACPARHAGSTDVFLEAIAAAQRGDVLVIDNTGRTDEGCIGDLVAGEAHIAGLAGLIVWGAHRDTIAIQAIGIPVWSIGACPNGPLELRTRSAHALDAASIGHHVTVTRDDVVFADVDGVVVVASAKVAQVVTAARDIAEREQAQAARLMAGERLRDQLQLENYVAQRKDDPTYTFRAHLKSLGGAIEI